MGSECWGRWIVPHRRCVGSAARCGARFSSRWRCRCTADVADASAMRCSTPTPPLFGTLLSERPASP
eukprot:7847719-Pyramimonas_sp.AAC.1